MRAPRLDDLPAPPPGREGWPWTEASPVLPASLFTGKPCPRISIVTPSFNQGDYLEETLRSVLLQGYPNLEYIVMDGGSTDHSQEIVRRYEPWLSYLHIGPDGGQSAAIREGFCHATGEIMAWLNSDDCYLPHTLARVAGFFTQHPRVGFCSGDVYVVDQHSHILKRDYTSSTIYPIAASAGFHGWRQPACFWRRTAYEQTEGLDPSLRFCMDRDLFLKLAKVCHSKRIPGAPLANFRSHATGKTTVMQGVQHEESQALIHKYGNPWLCNHPRLCEWVWKAWLRQTRVRQNLHKHFGWEY